jgi:tyrosine-protein kinase
MQPRMTSSDDSSRSLSDYVAILGRRWWLIALVTLVTVGAAALYTSRQPTEYRAVMKIVVGQKGTLFDPRLGNVADQFTQTMTDLLQSDVIAREVIQQLGLNMTTRDLLGQLDVITKPETAVLVVIYDDTDRARAVRVLHQIGVVFTGEVDQRLASAAAGDFAVSVTVFDDAHTVPDPVSPNPLRNLVVAGALGVLLGLLAAILREQLDDTIRSSDDAERAFGQTATATVSAGVVGFRPFARDHRRGQDPVLAELAMERLRAATLWTPESQESRTLLITSAGPEEGKTTISVNLAVLMVTEGRSVVLVEGDLRHPVLHRYLSMPPMAESRGLDAVLRGEVSLREAMIDVPVPPRAFAFAGRRDRGQWEAPARTGAPGRLRVMLAPPGRTQPAEVSLGRASEFLRDASQGADFVIIDSAPILIVPDAYPFVASVDTVLAVVRSGQTSGKAAAALSHTLERLGAKRVDLVVTDAEPSYGRSSYYGYARPPRPAAPSAGNGGSRSSRPAPAPGAGRP